MSESFDARVENLSGFTAALRQAPRTLQTEMLTAARRIGKRGNALSQTYVKRDTGATAASIFDQAGTAGDGVFALFGASSDAAIFVEKGRRPGAPMPPQGALLPWMAAHGIPESSEYVVRRAIARRGIKPRPFVSRAHKEMQRAGFYRKEFSEAIRRTLAKIGGRS